MRDDLERRGYQRDVTTRVMGMSLDDFCLPRPEIDLGTLNWSDYALMFGLPQGLLSGVDRAVFNIVVARLNQQNVATAMAFDHDGDCGIYNVGTLEYARRRGFGTALTTLLLHNAVARGCTTASLQSTPMAERVYASAGFRDLGQFFEYVPPWSNGNSGH